MPEATRGLGEEQNISDFLICPPTDPCHIYCHSSQLPTFYSLLQTPELLSRDLLDWKSLLWHCIGFQDILPVSSFPTYMLFGPSWLKKKCGPSAIKLDTSSRWSRAHLRSKDLELKGQSCAGLGKWACERSTCWASTLQPSQSPSTALLPLHYALLLL